jgi:peptide/nickel transport system permease protein/oligopeptide transport system permease protein
MAAYALRRLLAAVLVVLGVLVAVFVILRLAPGDPALMIAGENAPPDAVERVREELGLDQPLPVQLARYVGHVLSGDLGRSISSRRPVLQEIAQPLQNTYQLVVTALLLAILAGVPLGVLAAVHRGQIFDRLIVIVAVAGASFPSFWVGLLLIWYFSYQLGWFPISGWRGALWSPEWWRYATLPVLTLAITVMAPIARLTRSSMLEVLGQDYVRTARAKGLGERLVLYRHALRNAALPVLTLTAVQLGFFLGGTVVTENVFAIPGLGRLLVDAIGLRDYPLVQAGVLIFALTFVLINLFADLAYGLLDPRIRFD